MHTMLRRSLVAATAALLLAAGVGLPSAVGAMGGGARGGPEPRLADGGSGHDHTAHGVAGQNAMDHDRQMAAMDAVAEANGLTKAPGGGQCGDWYQFRTPTGLHCAKAPMLRDMFTTEQLAASTRPPAYAADPKVTCIGTGTDGKRVELVYARRSNKTDRYAATATQLKGWAAGIEQTMVLSAQKTGGVRKVRWVHDSNCVATVLNITVATTVTTFSDLVSALQAQGLTATNRKYLIAWDDGDATGAFCGLGETMPDSTAGATNQNETQPIGAMFAAAEPNCWTTTVAAHELMHTLGAVQPNAPHATQYGHCTDESDIMCYVDGAGSVMAQVCPASQEALYDCNNDDYFSTNPPVGNYLKTHWNPASSGFLDVTGSVGPPTAPQDPTITPHAGSVTVTWSAPAFNGGSPLLGYIVTISPGGRTVSVGAGTTTATVTGLADGTPVTASVGAANKLGTGTEAVTGSATPAPPVETIATTGAGSTYQDIARGPSGSVFVAAADRIDRVDADGTKTTVVHGTSTGEIAENTLPLETPVAPLSLAVDSGGNVIFYDSLTGKIRRLSGGHVNSIAGSGELGADGDNGSALAAAIDVSGLAVNPVDGAILFTDADQHVVRRFTVGGSINTVAGHLASGGFTGDGGSASSARLDGPQDLAIDDAGSVYVADTLNHRIRKFTVGGAMSTVAGDGTTPVYPGTTLVATATGVGYPSAIDWSSTKGLIIDTFGMERVLVGTNLVRLAGDLFDDNASDADGTLATVIDYTKNDQIDAIAWSGTAFHVVVNGPAPGGGGEGKLRTAGPWSTTATATAPDAPAGAPVATGGANSATVAWLPPGNGGSPITSYKVTASPGGAVTTAAASASSVTVPGLVAGTPYTFTVAGVNTKGTGVASPPSNAVTPTAAPTAPGAPTGASATPGSAQATVTWTAPASNGGSAITGYVVTPYIGATAKPSVASSGTGTSKVVTGLVNGTSYTFKVAAVNAIGTGTQSSPSAAVRPIAPYAPFSSWTAFVNRQYLDLTTKAPTSSSLSSWVSQLSAGTKKKGDLDDALRRGTENLSDVDPVVRVYRAFLGRAPDATGLKFWIKRRRNVAPAKTWTVTQIATDFTSSNEFKSKYGSLTNRAFVTRIYTDVLERTADQAGVDYWTKKLDTKTKTKAQVMVGFSESNEYKTKQAQNTDLAVAYIYLLGRTPTTPETTDWVTREKAGTAHATLLSELLNSAGYATHITG